ncbi:MAG: hypothetical protein HONBIEJF_01127 [Fimbriimonadaceae bacterium]|nr:hypothetical protein [Fimbriimonadaceae bacterium]
MIELLRSILIVTALVLMGGGYLASQYAAAFGNPISYSSAIDTPAISMLALIVLGGGIAIGFVNDHQKRAEDAG